LERDATVSDIIATIRDLCRDEGVELDKWARATVGADFQLVLLRKAEGNTLLAPGMTFGDIDPEICNNEKFKLGAQPVVGGLPMTIFNRRIEVLLDECYRGALAELYQRLSWPPAVVDVDRIQAVWRHELLSVRIVDRYPDGAYRTLHVDLDGVPALIALEHGTPVIGWRHGFSFVLPRDYPADLRIDIESRTPLFHPRIRAVGKNACYVVNGEVDRILIDLLYMTLLRPDLVRPPALYPDADWGVNRTAMKWLIDRGPQAAHDDLLRMMHERRSGPRVVVASGGQRARVTVLESPAR
jgi:hypothetical protein